MLTPPTLPPPQPWSHGDVRRLRGARYKIIPRPLLALFGGVCDTTGRSDISQLSVKEAYDFYIVYKTHVFYQGHCHSSKEPTSHFYFWKTNQALPPPLGVDRHCGIQRKIDHKYEENGMKYSPAPGHFDGFFLPTLLWGVRPKTINILKKKVSHPGGGGGG